jgi:phosphoesterase RecJ-like protein
VIVDVGERERIPQILPSGVGSARVLVIDHHMRHGSYGDVVWRRKASAVGEMLIELARYMGWTISTECAECAYTAILTDTGSFRYSSTTSSCLEVASFLVSLGVQPWKVASHVYESWPSERMQLLGDVLSTLELDCQGQLASLVVTKETIEARNASIDMTEGFVNQGRMIEGVEVSVLIRENGPSRYRLSFRSRGRVDVGDIAHRLGGGGHRNAAGASANGDVVSLKQRVAELVDEALSQLDPDDGGCWSQH